MCFLSKSDRNVSIYGITNSSFGPFVSSIYCEIRLILFPEKIGNRLSWERFKVDCHVHFTRSNNLFRLNIFISVQTRRDSSSNYRLTDKVWSSCRLSSILLPVPLPLPTPLLSSSSPPPILFFLQRRPCKLASFHSTDVSVPIGLSLRGDVLAILWNTPNTRARAHTHIRRRSQKHPNTRCDTAVVAAGVDVCADSHLRSLTLLFLPFPVCLCSKERKVKRRGRMCVCLCVYTQHILCDNLA